MKSWYAEKKKFLKEPHFWLLLSLITTPFFLGAMMSSLLYGKFTGVLGDLVWALFMLAIGIKAWSKIPQKKGQEKENE